MKTIFIILKGMAMGIAEVIPGVSGGTIAFITGIYERLLNCIKAFTPKLLFTFKKEGLNKVLEQIDAYFLLTLLSGMLIGIVTGVFGVSHLLEYYPTPLWAFFFGLIIASTIYIARQIKSWNLPKMCIMLLGAITAYGITILPVGAGTDSLPFIFISGAIAISALILPGISGSFILLLMGMYSKIIPTIKIALKTLDPNALLVLVVFAAGCLTGLMSFSRILSWTFKNHKEVTLALLTGFMLGSLNKIWPWRIAKDKLELLQDDGTVKVKVITEQNLWPEAYEIAGNDPMLLTCIVSLVAGFTIVFLLDTLGSKEEN